MPPADPAEASLPDEHIFGGCKGAITVRKGVVHKGRRNVLLKEVRDWMEHIETMMGFCKELQANAPDPNGDR